MVHLRLAGVSEDGRKLAARVRRRGGVHRRRRRPTQGRACAAATSPASASWRCRWTSAATSRHPGADPGRRDPRGRRPVAGTTVDKMMPYAAPCSPSASTWRSAPSAPRSGVAPPTAAAPAPAPSATRSAAICAAQNVDPDAVAWDAWRREDGRWTLTGCLPDRRRVGRRSPSTPRATTSSPTTTTPTGCSARCADAQRWPPAEVTELGDDLSTARRRRLAAVPPDELPLGEDAIDLVTEAPAATSRWPEPTARGERRARCRGPGRGLPRRPGRRRHRPGRRRASDAGVRPGRRGDDAATPSDSTTHAPRAGLAQAVKKPAAEPPCRAGTRSCSAAGLQD